MIKIGITGTIGSGKSIISNILEILEIPVYNADVNAKRIMLNDNIVKDKLIEYFGDIVYDGNSLNKKFLSERIFSLDSDRKFVNSVVHPMVIKDFQRWSDNQNFNIIAIESALLYEAQVDKIIDYVVEVKSPVELLIKRLILRDNISVEEAKNRINIQMMSQNFEKKANFVIINDEKSSVLEQILNIHKIIKTKCRQ
ncbi:MAG: dephospho-CoA kinase [Bacteroidales bacterium]|jgi:dephospho-CoA kinase|nr:dephospho-CoA kinase [Bacteroidales bacterium]